VAEIVLGLGLGLWLQLPCRKSLVNIFPLLYNDDDDDDDDDVEGDGGEYGSVVRPQVPQYVTLQILAILQPYPQERDARDQCITSDLGESFSVCYYCYYCCLLTRPSGNVSVSECSG